MRSGGREMVNFFMGFVFGLVVGLVISLFAGPHYRLKIEQTAAERRALEYMRSYRDV